MADGGEGMIGEVLSLLTPRGKYSLLVSAVAYAVYGLTGTVMMVLVLTMIAHICGSRRN